MRRFLWSVLVAFFCLQPVSSLTAEPVQLILDTDIGNDIDDALALALIHALENRGEVRLLGVTITKDNPYCAPFVDLVDTFYGRPDIPIGVVHGGKTPENSPMIQIPAQRRDAAGHYVYPHRLEPGVAQDAVQLLIRTLSDQPDRSVTIAQIGFSTNLARLLKTPQGRDLAQRKVKLLYLMAGDFVKPQPEYNVYTDPESAKFLFDQWPTPMIFSGFEIGSAVLFPYPSIQKDFGYVLNHPVAEAYNIFLPKHEDRPAWDPTAVLEAIRPDRGYFELSSPGRVSLGAKDVTIFAPNPDGNCRYLILKPEQTARVQAVLVTLVSEPPLQRVSETHARRLLF